MKELRLIYLILFFCCKGSLLSQNLELLDSTPIPLFISGFEPDTEIIQETTNPSIPYNSADLNGIDESVIFPSDFENDLENNLFMGGFEDVKIQYEGGKSPMRMAEIIQDIDEPNNNILESWIYDDWLSEGRGRVQLNLHNALYGFKTIHYSVRFKIPETFQVVSNNNNYTFGFFTLGEMFNNPGWTGEENRFRIQYGIRKISTSPSDSKSRFRFRASGEIRGANTPWSPIWEEYNDEFKIPIGKWMKMDVFYTEGDNSEGVFQIQITPEGENTINIIGFNPDNSPRYRATYNPLNPNPIGLRFLNPIQLYTNNSVIDFFKNNYGIKTNIFWDDFTIYNDSSLKKKYLTLNIEDCGKTLTTADMNLSTTPVAGDNPRYVFKLENNNDPTNTVWQMDYDPTVYLGNNPDLRSNATYNVSVKIDNHPVYGEYGDVCPVYTGNLKGFENKSEKSFESLFLKVYPNPNLSNKVTIVSFKTIDSEQHSKMYLLDQKGIILNEIINKKLNKGVYNQTIDTKGLPTGLYFLILENGEYKTIKKLIIKK